VQLRAQALHCILIKALEAIDFNFVNIAELLSLRAVRLYFITFNSTGNVIYRCIVPTLCFHVKLHIFPKYNLEMHLRRRPWTVAAIAIGIPPSNFDNGKVLTNVRGQWTNQECVIVCIVYLFNRFT
jgi:hypothetical protein